MEKYWLTAEFIYVLISSFISLFTNFLYTPNTHANTINATATMPNIGKGPSPEGS